MMANARLKILGAEPKGEIKQKRCQKQNQLGHNGASPPPAPPTVDDKHSAEIFRIIGFVELNHLDGRIHG